jgi:PTS system fructose-specific IIA component
MLAALAGKLGNDEVVAQLLNAKNVSEMKKAFL